MTEAAILCLSRSLWSEERAAHRNRYQVLTRLARRRRVVMVERPFELATLARPSAAKATAVAATLACPRRWPEGIVTIRPLGWWLRDGDDLSWRVNLALYRPWLRRAIALAGARHMTWVYDHRLWPVIDGASTRGTVYHCTEDYAGIAARSHGRATGDWVAQAERALLERADLVFTVSDGIAHRLAAAHGDVRTLRSGVDLELYRPVAPAPALIGLPRPVLGYVGEISFKVDLALLERVAEKYTSGTLVLVGADAEVSDDPTYRRIRARANVVRLGHRPPAELPGLIAGVDLCLIPFIQDDWFAQAAQPLKTFEYLACGKPVISTWLPNLLPCADVIDITRTGDDFLAACDAALARGDAGREGRLAAAAANDWASRVGEVEDALAALESSHRGRIEAA